MPSRISGACIACRSKKQKCSGDRAGCAQCRAAGQECVWPEQRKRGPAKGYIEGLEHRLHEAEQLLLQLLPIVSTDQLAAVTSTNIIDNNNNNINEDLDHSPSRRASPPLLNKKIGIEYWEQFPLDSADNIRRWQQDCADGRGLRQIRGRSISSESRAATGGATAGMSIQRRMSARPDPAAAAAQQLQYLSGQKEVSRSDPGTLRLSGLDRNDQPWSSLYADVPGAAPGAWPAGMDINSIHCSPWEQHSHVSAGQAMSMPAPASSSAMELDAQQYADQQNGSAFFTADSQRQFFW